MSSTALRGRRVVVVAVTAFSVGALAAVAPTSVSVAASAETTSAAPASPWRAAGGLVAAAVVPTTARAVAVPATARTIAVPAAPGSVASRSALRPAVIVPYRYGTTAYSKWWARSYMAKTYRWTSSGQFTCLVKLWTRESHWNHKAHNRGSGAHGIPQAMPGNKMAKYGSDWRTNPRTQIKWGLHYIKSVYGSPCGAWSHWTSHHWY